MTELFNKPKQTIRRKKLRNQPTKSETVFWKYAKGSRLGFKFRRQCGIGPYIVDFYCPEVHLVVEIDGYTHDDEFAYEQDVERQKYLESLGLVVKRYSSQEIFKRIREVIGDVCVTCESLRRTTPSPPS